jgi:hypothetical protein
LQLAKVLAFHKKMHPEGRGAFNRIILSCDGVQEARSSATSIVVFTIQFYGCRTVYLVGSFRPGKGGCDKDEKKKQTRAILQRLVDEIKYVKS